MDDYGLDFALKIAQSTRQSVQKAVTWADRIAKSTIDTYRNQKLSVSLLRAHLEARKRSVDLAERLRQKEEGTNRSLSERIPLLQGISNALGNAKGYVVAAIGIYSVKEAMEALIGSGERLDEMLTKSRVAFGGYTNALKGYKKFQDGIASGDLIGTAQEFMDASSILMKKGVKMTDDNIAMLNNWAAGAGKSVTETAGAIEAAIGGDLGAFEEFGISQREMSRHFAKYQGDTVMMRGAIMDYMKTQKQFEDGAKNSPLTWQNIGQRIGAMASKFKESIIGHANDPNSLNNLIKREVTNILDWFKKNAAFFKVVATFISAMLKWVFKQVGNFARWILNKAQSAIDSMSGLMLNYRERIAGLVLYLELIKLKVLGFLREYKGVILTALKLLLMFKIAQKAFHIGKSAYDSLVRYRLQFLKFIADVKGSRLFLMMQKGFNAVASSLSARLGPALMSARTAMMGLNATMLANPIGLIIIAIVLLIGWIVYLVTQWNHVRASMQDVSDGALMLLSSFAPIIGLPLLIAKHWEKLKAIFINVFNTISNIAQLAWLRIKDSFMTMYDSVVNFFAGIGEWLTENITLPAWMTDFGAWLWESLIRVKDKISGFFTDLVPDWMKNMLGDDLTAAVNVTKDMANSSSSALEEYQKKTGRTVTAERGVSAKSEASTIDLSKDTNVLDMFSGGGGVKDNVPMLERARSNVKDIVPSAESNSSFTFFPGAIVIQTPSGSSPDLAKEIAKEVEKVMKKMQNEAALKGRNN